MVPTHRCAMDGALRGGGELCFADDDGGAVFFHADVLEGGLFGELLGLFAVALGVAHALARQLDVVGDGGELAVIDGVADEGVEGGVGVVDEVLEGFGVAELEERDFGVVGAGRRAGLDAGADAAGFVAEAEVFAVDGRHGAAGSVELDVTAALNGHVSPQKRKAQRGLGFFVFGIRIADLGVIIGKGGLGNLVAWLGERIYE